MVQCFAIESKAAENRMVLLFVYCWLIYRTANNLCSFMFGFTQWLHRDSAKAAVSR